MLGVIHSNQPNVKDTILKVLDCYHGPLPEQILLDFTMDKVTLVVNIISGRVRKVGQT